jgi:hypothetical protein
MVHAGIEVGARGAHLLERWYREADDSLPVRTLRALNRSRSPAAKHSKVRWLDVAERSLVAWASGGVLFVGNLAGAAVDLRLDRIGAGLSPLEPLRRAKVSADGLALHLGPYGFVRFQLDELTSPEWT